MRRSGYFQIMVAFAIANMLYFSVNLVYRGLMTLSAVSVIPGGKKNVASKLILNLIFNQGYPKSKGFIGKPKVIAITF